MHSLNPRIDRIHIGCKRGPMRQGAGMQRFSLHNSIFLTKAPLPAYKALFALFLV
jgi:hypothetical protein